MKIKVPGPQAGYDWDGHIVSFAPGAVVEIDDQNAKAVAWAKAWLGTGATLVEDAKSAKAEAPKAEPPKQPPAPSRAEPVKATGGRVNR